MSTAAPRMEGARGWLSRLEVRRYKGSGTEDGDDESLVEPHHFNSF